MGDRHDIHKDSRREAERVDEIIDSLESAGVRIPEALRARVESILLDQLEDIKLGGI